MFSNAIVRKPCKHLAHGLTTAQLGEVSLSNALNQHKDYISVLKHCGLKVTVLPENDQYPDSTFIEDVAVCDSEFALITNPGHQTRKGEIFGMKKVLLPWYTNIGQIKHPGSLDGGDVLKIENHYYVGITERTNKEGAQQLIDFVSNYGYAGTMVECNNILHLKSGVSYLGDHVILVEENLAKSEAFAPYQKIMVAPEEEYAANAIEINNYILIPKGFPKTRDILNKYNYQLVELAVSEFRKLDGGLSCLSLRF